MVTKAEAWVLHAGDGGKPDRAKLSREMIDIPPLRDREVLVEPLYGCWEGNMDHALNRRPIDICIQRREPKVVIGNSGVVRVLQIGYGVTTVEPGQIAILFCVGDTDRFGYPDKIMAYDLVGSMGCLATKMKCFDHNLIAVPEGTQFSLAQWAAFSLRYVTAWSNWELAHGVFRIQVSKEQLLAPNVWGWGGGTTQAELDLARLHGCRVVMISGNDHHLARIAAAGIQPLDRRQFGELGFDEERYKKDAEYREKYKLIEASFLNEVRRRTKGEMVQIFIDYVGGSVYRLTLRALSREGVITTAGWKEGMTLTQLRAKECIDRHQHVYSHYAKYSQGVAAVAYAELHGWMPLVDERIYTFDQIPELAEDYHASRTDYFPCYSIVPS
jgi:NADPH:quinone reductase-like Zn-dependent oxidoreductase